MLFFVWTCMVFPISLSLCLSFSSSLSWRYMCAVAVHYSIIRTLSKPGSNLVCIQLVKHITFVDLLEFHTVVLCHRHRVHLYMCVAYQNWSNKKRKTEKQEMLTKIYYSYVHNVFVFDWFEHFHQQLKVSVCLFFQTFLSSFLLKLSSTISIPYS